MKTILCAGLMLMGVSSPRAEEVASPRYKITDLTPNSQQHCEVSGLNEKGEVVGTMEGRAFLWRKGKLSFLGKLPGSLSCEATDVNDAGQVVGTCSLGEWDTRYFFWENGSMQDLGAVPAFVGKVAINQSGEVLLHLQTKNKTQAVIWKNGKQRNLGDWWPWSINNKGEVAGVKFLARPVTPTTTVRERRRPDQHWAVIWQNGSPVAAGLNGSFAVLINDNHDFVLWKENHEIFPGHRQSFLVHDGKQTLLAEYDLNQDKKAVFEMAMNNHRQIIGVSFQTRSAFLWNAGQWHNLNNLIPANSGWVLNRANDINERGQIVGTGTLKGEPRAFLLTPLAPTPPTG